MLALQSPAVGLLAQFHQPHQWYADTMTGGAKGCRAEACPGVIGPVSPSPCFPTGTPPSLIVRRYLSLLDTAVELELPGYQGPRLPQRQRVPIFPQPLITDRARCKYRWARGMAATGAESRKARADVS